MKPICIPEKLYESQKDVFDVVIAEVIEALVLQLLEENIKRLVLAECALVQSKG